MDGEQQGVHAGAAIIVSVVVGVSAAFRVIVPVPGVVVADRLAFRVVRAVVDGQLQRIHLRAAVGIEVAKGVVATGGVSRTVSSRPSIALASCFVCGSVCWMVDGQVVCDDAVAAVHS